MGLVVRKTVVPDRHDCDSQNGNAKHVRVQYILFPVPPSPADPKSAVEHRASRYRSRSHPSTAKRQGAAATSDWPAERYTVVRARARHAYTTYGCTPAAVLLGEHRVPCDGAV